MEIPGNSAYRRFSPPAVATHFRRLLHRILHRLGNGLQGLPIVLVGDLEIVALCYLGAVADPFSHHLNWQPLGKLSLPTAPEVLE